MQTPEDFIVVQNWCVFHAEVLSLLPMHRISTRGAHSLFLGIYDDLLCSWVIFVVKATSIRVFKKTLVFLFSKFLSFFAHLSVVTIYWSSRSLSRFFFYSSGVWLVSCSIICRHCRISTGGCSGNGTVLNGTGGKTVWKITGGHPRAWDQVQLSVGISTVSTGWEKTVWKMTAVCRWARAQVQWGWNYRHHL